MGRSGGGQYFLEFGVSDEAMRQGAPDPLATPWGRDLAAEARRRGLRLQVAQWLREEVVFWVAAFPSEGGFLASYIRVSKGALRYGRLRDLIFADFENSARAAGYTLPQVAGEGGDS